ncbi:ubiquitin carboxyl-terminal hydrolase 15-like isoform X1 [Ylistrum balloti]|uniref:ubiquitin carboxyl-terminal hydrolase 15-like isoform X1 n=1 Tax=Ylistrum balloti TaxID=509963 RepID=UPI002905EBA4|nr:ubiquitin carboxyl-terminal hydrolase 15-like isoform X1 [Ylistrum balloti]
MAEGGVVEMSEDTEKIPDCAKQKSEIANLMKKTLKKGDTWYLLDTKWYKQWKKYVGYDSWDSFSVGEQNSHPGPMDNSPLVKEEEGGLKHHLIEELDYMLLPEEAWEKMLAWYGLTKDQEPIARGVIEQGTFVKHFKVEVYLLDVKLCRNSDLETVITKHFSRVATIETIEKEMRNVFEIPEDKEVRLWNKYMASTYEHLNKPEHTLQDAGLYTGQTIVIEEKNEDGTWPRQAKSTNTYTSTSTSTNSRTSSIGSTSHDSSSGYSGGTSYNSYYNSTSSYEPGRGHATPGLCGLANLGNTCFMNSALQCMSSVPMLTQYFLNDDWVNEVNEDNPLGMRGEIARSYAELIKTLWSGKYSYTAPRNFKYAVGRFAPQFSGFQQQDSQELMAFLLDGLHEDLNRIRQKPYIEMKDTDCRPDKEVAKESWENYRKRNDSVIVDTFHGLLKSTVHCPECAKISVTFDPFCYLSLPLPIKKERQLEVFWVPLSPQKKPVQFKLTVPKMGTVLDLCNALSAHVQTNPDKMAVTDVYSHRFHKIFSHDDTLNNILDRDDIFIYEVPVAWDDPDTVIVPIYMREKRMKNQYSSYQMSTYQLFGQPLLLPVPRRECTYQILYNQLLQRVSRYVKVPENAGCWWKDEEDGQMADEGKDNGESTSSDETTKESGMENDQKQINGDANEMEISAANGSKDGEIEDKQTGSNENTENCDNINMEPPPLFKFRMVNSYGSAEIDHKLKNDGNPLRLHNRTHIAVDWHPLAKDQFYDEQAAEDLEQHESVKQRVQRKQVLQLDDCVELFTRVEQLGENDLWYCPQCKKHQQATKKFDLWSLPDVLIIHLKRFSYNRYYRDKIDTLIEFPYKGLNLKKYLINKEHGCATYDLIAVTNHYGGLGGGHYTAYGKRVEDEEWHYFDDSSVSSASEDDVTSKAAYVLVYEKQGTRSKQMKCTQNSHTAGGAMENGSTNSLSDEEMETT